MSEDVPCYLPLPFWLLLGARGPSWFGKEITINYPEIICLLGSGVIYGSPRSRIGDFIPIRNKEHEFINNYRPKKVFRHFILWLQLFFVTLRRYVCGKDPRTNAQFLTELPPRIKEFKSKMYTIGVYAIVRRLQHTVYKVVVDLVRSMDGVCAFLFIYNKVARTSPIG